MGNGIHVVGVPGELNTVIEDGDITGVHGVDAILGLLVVPRVHATFVIFIKIFGVGDSDYAHCWHFHKREHRVSPRFTTALKYKEI